MTWPLALGLALAVALVAAGVRHRVALLELLGFAVRPDPVREVDRWLAALAGSDLAARADAARCLAPKVETTTTPALVAAAPRIVPALFAVLDDPDPNVRKWALWGLAGFAQRDRLELTRVLPLVERALDDEDWNVRVYACFACEQLGGDARSAEPRLRALTADPKRDVQVAAKGALRALKRPRRAAAARDDPR